MSGFMALDFSGQAALLRAIASQEAEALVAEAQGLGEELAEVQGQVEGQITPLVARVAADGMDPSLMARMQSATRGLDEVRAIGASLHTSVLHEQGVLKSGQEERALLREKLQALQEGMHAARAATSQLDRLTHCGSALANHYVTQGGKS